ncbi:MAG: DUF3857 domain-containing protein [Alphaproteobacteria bacterium]|nr:MAG: DUF3857 domain-containing protein [Alphaproteobacteria bacterium]
MAVGRWRTMTMCMRQAVLAEQYGRGLAAGLASFLAGLLAIAGSALAAPGVASTTLEFAPVPDWVEVYEFDHAPADPDAADAPEDGVAIRLLEGQVNFSGGTFARYQRTVYAVYSKAGIAPSSILYGVYYNGSQTLRIGAFRIWRDGEPIDVADRAMVQVVNSASNLQGELAADATVVVIYVPDLRVGDLLEFATLISGDSPGLEDQRTDIYKDSPTVPIGHLYRRIVTDTLHPVSLHVVGGAVAPEKRVEGERVEYLYHAENVEPAAETPDHVPPWYYAEPMTIVSGAANWGDVVAWGRERLIAPGPVDDKVAAKARELTAGVQDPNEKLARLAAFVQGKVKYLGPGLSRNGYRPFAPGDVLTRRWGDCKDKVNLLLAMLEAVGIEAYPALAQISTGYVDPEIPTPLAFDHLILAAEIGGETQWVDATGTPRDATRPSYEQARTNLVLPLRAGQTDLVPLPVPRTVGPDGYDIDMATDVDLRSGRKATFTVSYAGLSADHVRGLLDSSSPSVITQTYLAKVKSLGDYVEADGEPIVTDSYVDNRIVVAQDFKARYFWVWDKEKARYGFEAWPLWLRDFAPSVSESDAARSVPYALPFPQDVRERYHIRLPEGMTITPMNERLERDAYLFSFETEREGRDLTLSIVFRTYRDHLKPDEIAAYRDDRKTFANWSYALWTPDSKRVPEAMQKLFDQLAGGTEVRSANIPEELKTPATPPEDARQPPDGGGR